MKNRDVKIIKSPTKEDLQLSESQKRALRNLFAWEKYCSKLDIVIGN